MVKKGGGFCEMMRGCSVREMAARGAWGLPRMEMRDLECVQRGEMEERVRTESLKRRGGGRWRRAQKRWREMETGAEEMEGDDGEERRWVL